jgi:hypothetical protein
MTELLKCIGIALMVTAALVIIIAFGTILALYNETLAGLVALFLIILFFTYFVRREL